MPPSSHPILDRHSGPVLYLAHHVVALRAGAAEVKAGRTYFIVLQRVARLQFGLQRGRDVQRGALRTTATTTTSAQAIAQTDAALVGR